MVPEAKQRDQSGNMLCCIEGRRNRDGDAEIVQSRQPLAWWHADDSGVAPVIADGGKQGTGRPDNLPINVLRVIGVQLPIRLSDFVETNDDQLVSASFVDEPGAVIPVTGRQSPAKRTNLLGEGERVAP